MHNLPFDTVGLDASEVDALENNYKILEAKFNTCKPGDVDINIRDFDLLNCNKDVIIGGILAINHQLNECYIAFSKIHYVYHSTRGGINSDFYRYQAWGYVNLKKDYGRVLIRRETFTDKILSLIHPVELEFKDDKAFNHKFYVVTNDEKKSQCSHELEF